ncbi:MAG: carboxypeptidase regulatory-like domain-containing protein [Acidobacteria bacterium]|nr:carboxypeptidase regulatory-like domain-containing protein [Acidobacteriota bacterium]
MLILILISLFVFPGQIKETPVPRAKVVVQNKEARFEAVTDMEGKFALAGIPAGTYEVSVASETIKEFTVFMEFAYEEKGEKKRFEFPTPLMEKKKLQIVTRHDQVVKGRVCEFIPDLKPTPRPLP